jgi:hypothetical protein
MLGDGAGMSLGCEAVSLAARNHNPSCAAKVKGKVEAARSGKRRNATTDGSNFTDNDGRPERLAKRRGKGKNMGART